MDSKSLKISQRIFEVRAHFDLTKEALGELAEVSGTSIANIESGITKNPGTDLLSAIANKLGVDGHWLLTGRGEMLKQETVERTSSNIPAVSEPAPQPIGRGKPATYKGKTVATLRLGANQPQEPVGTDLIKLVSKNTREIELIQQTLETVVAELRQLTSNT